MRSTALALCFVLVSGAALADGSRLAGLPAELLGGAIAEGTQHILASPPVPVVRAGGTNIVLGETPLSDLAPLFGGEIQHAADGGESASWLCYSVSPGGEDSLIWFVSDGAAGGSNHVVTLVATSLGAPKPNCDSPTGPLKGMDLPVPDLGAAEADLRSAFGIVDAKNGFVAYMNQTTGSDGAVTIQTLNYVLKDSVVTGLAASQITGP